MKLTSVFILMISFCCCVYAQEQSLKTYYPSIEPYVTGRLEVDSGHSLYWEESGNPHGVPILFLHGGPGSGTNADQRRFFDPEHYRIVLFDQRGCGKSLPSGDISHNSTQDLVHDIEALRASLKIDKFIVFGGSWGSTLGLVYAIEHPDHIRGMILRGIFLGRQKELDWFYKKGANLLTPKTWEIFLNPIPENEREDLVAAYYKRLNSDVPEIRKKAVAAWVLWEYANSQSNPGLSLFCLLNLPVIYNYYVEQYGEKLLPLAKIECHYFINKCFLRSDNWILENIDRIQHIPSIIIQGHQDQICHMEIAVELHQAWPKSKLEVLTNSGHSAEEPEILDALIRATEEFKNLAD
jgi:proline iminopeptidase